MIKINYFSKIKQKLIYTVPSLYQFRHLDPGSKRGLECRVILWHSSIRVKSFIKLLDIYFKFMLLSVQKFLSTLVTFFTDDLLIFEQNYCFFILINVSQQVSCSLFRQWFMFSAKPQLTHSFFSSASWNSYLLSCAC